MEVPIYVILQPQHPLAAFIRPQDDVTTCGPMALGKEPEAPVLIAPQFLHLELSVQDEPLPNQLLQKSRPMVGMT